MIALLSEKAVPLFIALPTLLGEMIIAIDLETNFKEGQQKSSV